MPKGCGCSYLKLLSFVKGNPKETYLRAAHLVLSSISLETNGEAKLIAGLSFEPKALPINVFKYSNIKILPTVILR